MTIEKMVLCVCEEIYEHPLGGALQTFFFVLSFVFFYGKKISTLKKFFHCVLGLFLDKNIIFQFFYSFSFEPSFSQDFPFCAKIFIHYFLFLAVLLEN